jgi:hypothetical protein
MYVVARQMDELHTELQKYFQPAVALELTKEFFRGGYGE